MSSEYVKHITPYSPEANTAIPLKGVRFLRKFLPYQLWRFLVINVKMMVLIMRSHH